MESRASVSETLLAGAESAEVLSSLWDYIIVEVEVDAAGLLCWRNVSSLLAMRGRRWGNESTASSTTTASL